MRAPLESCALAALLALLCAAGYVSGNPGPLADPAAAQRAGDPHEEHVEHYEAHRAMLGIDRLNCR